MSILSNIVHSVYIDPEWVAAEYLKRCKEGVWQKKKTKEALKCFNLEGILTAAQYNLETPDGVGMGQYIEGDDKGNQFIDELGNKLIQKHMFRNMSIHEYQTL